MSERGSFGERVKRELSLRKSPAEINLLDTEQRRKIRHRAAVASVALASGPVSVPGVAEELGLGPSALRAVSGAVESLCARGWVSCHAGVVRVLNRRALVGVVLQAEELGAARCPGELRW